MYCDRGTRTTGTTSIFISHEYPLTNSEVVTEYKIGKAM
jgi:hypothetical protein